VIGVITMLTPKGGTGKSTMARSLAAHWMSVGHNPALVDADPQQTLAGSYNAAGPMGSIPVAAEPEERVAEVIEELRQKHRPVIVDTAGFRNRTAVRALIETDLVIIPLKPSREDLEGAVAAYTLIQEINDTPERAGRPIRATMVLTMTMPNTVISRHVRDQIVQAGYPLMKAEMVNRVAYPETGIEGLSPSIVAPDGAAARDIALIAQEIMNLEVPKIMINTSKRGAA
jgi:chromosome partitioning protein